MGCGFDSSLVWSSTETSPEVCETDPSNQAISYASCGNFVSALEQLYASLPGAFAGEVNPLRLNADSQASSDFENVQFPTRFNWIINKDNGIASLDDTGPYLYDFEGSLSSAIDAKIVFATSGTYNGNLGGLAGADAKCQELADVAGLPGTYRAWLSDGTASVSDRFDRDHDYAPFLRSDRVRIADDWEDLTDGTLLVAINRDEFGNTLDTTGGGDSAWTNTDKGGARFSSTQDCGGWTSTGLFTSSSYSGFVSETDVQWTAKASRMSCQNQHRLYCFQQVSFGPNSKDSSPQLPTHRDWSSFWGNTGEMLGNPTRQ